MIWITSSTPSSSPPWFNDELLFQEPAPIVHFPRILLLGNVAEIQNFLRITKINLWSNLATRGEECIYIPL